MNDHYLLSKKGFFMFIGFIYICGLLTGYLTFLNINKQHQEGVIFECNPYILKNLNKSYCNSIISFNNITVEINSSNDRIIFNGDKI